MVVDRVIRQANDTLCAMTGFSRDEMIGKSARMLYPTQVEYERVGREKYDEIHLRGMGSVETRWRRKDGEEIDILLSSSPIDLSDLSLGVTFTALDITQRKRAEEALRRSEATLQSLIRVAPVGICIMKNRIYQSANVFWCETFGYREEDILGKNTRMLYESDEEYERVGRDVYGQLVERGVASTETVLRRSDGALRNVVITASHLRGDDPSAGAVVVIHDITDRKRAEEALRESETLFRNLFEHHSAVKLIIDPGTGRIIDANTAAAGFYGWTREQLRRMSIRDINTLTPREIEREM
jgi:PAS domain S-box-containing protein